MDANSIGRPVVDKLVRKQLTISASGAESAAVEYQSGRSGYAVALIPLIEVFESNIGLNAAASGRYKIGITMKLKEKEESILNDMTDISLLNKYFSLENAKPILLGHDETLEIKAEHITIGKSPGSFAAITVEVLFLVSYLTPDEFLAFNRRTK